MRKWISLLLTVALIVPAPAVANDDPSCVFTLSVLNQFEQHLSPHLRLPRGAVGHVSPEKIADWIKRAVSTGLVGGKLHISLVLAMSEWEEALTVQRDRTGKEERQEMRGYISLLNSRDPEVLQKQVQYYETFWNKANAALTPNVPADFLNNKSINGYLPTFLWLQSDAIAQAATLMRELNTPEGKAFLMLAWAQTTPMVLRFIRSTTLARPRFGALLPTLALGGTILGIVTSDFVSESLVNFINDDTGPLRPLMQQVLRGIAWVLLSLVASGFIVRMTGLRLGYKALAGSEAPLDLGGLPQPHRPGILFKYSVFRVFIKHRIRSMNRQIKKLSGMPVSASTLDREDYDPSVTEFVSVESSDIEMYVELARKDLVLATHHLKLDAEWSNEIKKFTDQAMQSAHAWGMQKVDKRLQESHYLIDRGAEYARRLAPVKAQLEGEVTRHKQALAELTSEGIRERDRDFVKKLEERIDFLERSYGNVLTLLESLAAAEEAIKKNVSNLEALARDRKKGAFDPSALRALADSNANLLSLPIFEAFTIINP